MTRCVSWCAAAGETPLTCASYCGHYAAVKALLEVGYADVNLARQDGTTPLNLAAYADAKTALLLLDYGARPDTNTSKSSPFPVPLVMSAARGDVDLCTRLIQVRCEKRHRVSQLFMITQAVLQRLRQAQSASVARVPGSCI